jgi:hypothetical protein
VSLDATQIRQETLGPPDHDLILELSSMLTGLHCHVRHYVHEGAHLVIAGQLSGSDAFTLPVSALHAY